MPFPSHEIDPYRGLSPHFDIASARARALHALGTGTARLVVASAPALLPRLSAPARLQGHRLRPQAGRRDLADRPGRSPGGGRLHAPGSDRRAGRVLGPRRRRRFLSRRRAPSDPPRVHRRQHRIAAHLRSRHAALHRADRPGARRPAAGTAAVTQETRDRRSQRDDRRLLRRHVSPTDPRLGARRSARRDRQAARTHRGELRRGRCARTSARRSPRRSSSSWDDLAPSDRSRPRRSRRWRWERRTRSATSRRSPRWSSPAACPTGSRSCARRARPAKPWSSSRTRRDAPIASIEMLADYQVPAAPIDRGEDAHARVGARRRRPAVEGLPPARRRACSSGPRPTSSTRSASPTSGAAPRREDLPVGFPRSEDGRSRRPRRQRHRRVRRPEEDRGRPRVAGVHGAPLRRRRQALRPGRAARPRSEVHRRGAARARQAGRDDVGEGEDPRQEGDARHGGGAAEALRLAQGDPRPRVQPRQPLAAGVRGRVRVGADDRSAERRHRHQARHGVARRRWIACCAATSATARPKSRCAPRSRRSWTASRSRSSRRRPCSRSST